MGTGMETFRGKPHPLRAVAFVPAALCAPVTALTATVRRYGMETPFAFRSPADTTCVPHRGDIGKRLFPLNHFITTAGGSRRDAGKVDARQRVLDRAHRCERERGGPVGFVAVDCTTIGDARGAVAALDGERVEAAGAS